MTSCGSVTEAAELDQRKEDTQLDPHGMWRLCSSRSFSPAKIRDLWCVLEPELVEAPFRLEGPALEVYMLTKPSGIGIAID